MIGLIALLLACGIDGERDRPNPPPQPPGRFAQPVDATRRLEGVVTDATLATRSFSLVADGKRYVAVLTPSANVLVDGRAAGLDAVPPGATARVEAQIHDDVLMVQRLSVGAEPEPAVPPVVVPGDIAASGSIPDSAAPPPGPESAPTGAAGAAPLEPPVNP